MRWVDSGARRQSLFVGAWFAVSLITLAQGTFAEELAFSSEALMEHVRVLAGEEFRGRRAGSEDERRAADYIAKQLDELGVAPLPDAGRFHEFAITRGGQTYSKKSRNVLGWIEGSDPRLRHEIVVIGAHYDHMGIIRDEIYPGADDNCTGVAAMLRVAARIQGRSDGLPRSVLVAFFGSEEIGLVGSRRFVAECPVPLSQIVAMINADMIGRNLLDLDRFKMLKSLLGIDSANGLGVVGANTRPAFSRIVERSAESVNMAVYGARTVPFLSSFIDSMAKNRSDNYPFEDVGVPTLFFSSGEHEDYHRPGDTADKVDAELLARRTQIIHDTIVAVASAPPSDLPPIQNVQPPASEPVATLDLEWEGLRVTLRDNSDSPQTLSGLQSLVHEQDSPGFDAFDPDTAGASAGLNFEHVISGHKNAHNRFTPRKGRYRLFRLDDGGAAVLVRRREDSPWDVSSTLRYSLVEPHAVDFEFRCTPHSVERFGRRRSAIFFFANYMNDVTAPTIHFRGIDHSDGPEQWIAADAPPGHKDWNQGGTYRARGAAAIEYDKDQEFTLNSWSYDYPRFTEPFYYGRTANNMVFMLMFDRAHTDQDEIRFSMFKFKLPAKPRPAWDFQYVVHKVQPNQEYGFRGRLVWKKWVSPEDCVAEYEHWLSGQAGQ